MNVVIRVDGSTEIGSGHVMRCLTLATALEKQGARVLFVCKMHAGNFSNYIESQNFQVALIPLEICHDREYFHSQWLMGDEISDARKTVSVALENLGSAIDVVIVDHYGIAKPWERYVSDFTDSLVIIDDLADREHAGHFLIDQSYGRTPREYEGKVSAGCQLLVGAAYIMLRDEFLNHSNACVRERRSRLLADELSVLVMMGGTDPDNLSKLAIDALGNNTLVREINVVLSANSPYSQDLVAKYRRSENVSVYINPKSVADILLDNDLAVGAAGSSSWERCKMGLPSLLNVNAPNQSHIAERLHRNGICGIVEEDRFEQSINDFIDNLSHIDKYLSVVEKCLNLCDGFGTQRIVEKIIAHALR